MSQTKPKLRAPEIDTGSKNNAAIRRMVAEEVHKMKTEVSEALLTELREMREIITREVMDTIQTYLDQELTRIPRSRNGPVSSANIQEVKREVMEEMDRKLEGMNNQIVLSNNKQILATKQLTKEMAGAITAAASKQVYQAVISEINTKIVPKVNDMVQWVNYNMQDTGELITDYRRAVEEQSRGGDMKLLASSRGEDKSRWAGGNVGLFFTEDSVGI